MRPKPKVIFDTNIFVSAILFGGNPRTCLELARGGQIALFTSRALLLELSQKLKDKFRWSQDDIVEIIEGIGKFAKIVEPKQAINIIKKDPVDNRVLECALEAKANYIISGDKKHLLSIRKFENIPIISAKEFLDRFYKKKS